MCESYTQGRDWYSPELKAQYGQAVCHQEQSGKRWDRQCEHGPILVCLIKELACLLIEVHLMIFQHRWCITWCTLKKCYLKDHGYYVGENRFWQGKNGNQEAN